MSEPTFQLFWRCVHFPSAMENFWYGQDYCPHGCHTQELKPHHSGVHPTPKSGGTLAARLLW